MTFTFNKDKLRDEVIAALSAHDRFVTAHRNDADRTLAKRECTQYEHLRDAFAAWEQDISDTELNLDLMEQLALLHHHHNRTLTPSMQPA